MSAEIVFLIFGLAASLFMVLFRKKGARLAVDFFKWQRDNIGPKEFYGENIEIWAGVFEIGFPVFGGIGIAYTVLQLYLLIF